MCITIWAGDDLVVAVHQDYEDVVLVEVARLLPLGADITVHQLEPRKMALAGGDGDLAGHLTRVIYEHRAKRGASLHLVG